MRIFISLVVIKLLEHFGIELNIIEALGALSAVVMCGLQDYKEVLSE